MTKCKEKKADIHKKEQRAGVVANRMRVRPGYHAAHMACYEKLREQPHEN